MRDRRRRIAGDVSDQSYDGWRAYSDRFGVSVAAYLEVLGLTMAELVADGVTYDTLTPLSRRIVDDARVLDTERRRRAGLERRPSW